MGNPSISLNSGAGAAHASKGTSVQTLILSVSTGLVLFAVQIILFQVLRLSNRLKKIYQPRTYLVPQKFQVAPQPKTPWAWFMNVFKTPEQDVIDKCGLDAYFFLRFLGMCLKIFVPLAVLILPILVPINATGGKNQHFIAGQQYNVTGLDTLAWSNISPAKTDRYWAHLLLALVVVGWTCYNIFEELVHYISQRQRYLTSPAHRLRASATTVLVTGIPHEYRSVKALEDLYDVFPGGIRRIWLNRSLATLRDKVIYRRKLINHLENGETNLIRNVMQAKEKKDKKAQKDQKKEKNRNSVQGTTLKADGGHMVEPDTTEVDDEVLDHRQDISGWDKKDLQHDIDTNALWQRYISPKSRDTIRILRGGFIFWSSIPIAWLVGIPFTKKVDRIYFCRREIRRLNREIEQLRDDVENIPGVNSAFIQFNSQVAAHMCCQSISHHQPMQMSQRLVEVSPSDVVWYNLTTYWWSQYLRYFGFLCILLGLLIIYIIIGAFTGILSRVQTLTNTTSWLAWLQTLPSWALAFIQGVLPPVIMQSILIGLLPMFLRWLIRVLIRQPTRTAVELSLQNWYFNFMVIILFVVPTISAGLTTVVADIINNPVSIPNILATNLPSAANYYFSYLIIQSLSLSASAVSQLVRLFVMYVITPIPTNSARDRYNQSLDHLKYHWGRLFPWYTIFAVIGIVYSVIAPLMLIFLLITYSLFWVVSKNNIIYAVRNSRDSGGRFFPRAITQLFVGLYFLELSLTGLFFLTQNEQGNSACTAQGVIMVVALVLTAMYQIWLKLKLDPLFTYLPITLEDDAVLADREFELERLNTHSDSDEMQRSLDSDTKSQVEVPDVRKDSYLSTPRDRYSSIGRSPRRPSRVPGQQEEEQRRERQAAIETLAALEMKSKNEAPLKNTETASSENSESRAEAQEVIRAIVSAQVSQLQNFTDPEIEEFISLAFEDPALLNNIPIAWFPPDDLGVAEDEMGRTKRMVELSMTSTDGAYFNKDGKAMFTSRPPDYSLFAEILPEL